MTEFELSKAFLLCLLPILLAFIGVAYKIHVVNLRPVLRYLFAAIIIAMAIAVVFDSYQLCIKMLDDTKSVLDTISGCVAYVFVLLAICLAFTEREH